MQIMPRIQKHAKPDERDILNLLLDTISGDALERARVAADLSHLAGKNTWHQRNDAQAMEQQINEQDKGEAA